MIQVYNDSGITYYSIFRGNTVFNSHEINFLKADVNYTHLHLKGQPPIISSYNLKSFQDCLPNHQFVRPNKSTLLNIDLVERIVKNELILKDNSRIKISRRRIAHVRDSIKNTFNN